jgi:hypothetical protein
MTFVHYLRNSQFRKSHDEQQDINNRGAIYSSNLLDIYIVSTAYMGYVVVPPRVGYPATPDDPPIFTVQPSSNEYRMGEPIALTLTLSIPYHAVEYYWETCTFARMSYSKCL